MEKEGNVVIGNLNKTLRFALIFITGYLFVGLLLSRPVCAAESAPSDVDVQGETFKSFGSVDDDDFNSKLPCKFVNDAPHAVFDLLFKWTVQEDTLHSKTMDQSVERDICVSQYMPLGAGRFLVLYRGIGFVNVTSGKYSRLYGQWVDDESVTALSQLNSATSVAIYEATLTRPGVEGHNFYALFFRKMNDKSVLVQDASLTASGADYVNEAGEPFCTENGGEATYSASFASSILSPSVSTNMKQGKAIFAFVLRSKNCKSGAMKNVKQLFTFDGEKLTDKNGKKIQIENLENN